MTKMFQYVTGGTWNPWKGCLHDCSYCWARKLAEGKLKALGGKYADGFKPELRPSDLERHFKPGERVFVCAMGDLFGRWVPDGVIQAVIDVTDKWPETDFLFVTKHPSRYAKFHFSRNTILGATVESDLEYERIYGEAWRPEPNWQRLFIMQKLKHPRKFISVEPMMDFHSPLGFAHDIAKISPEMVEVGADNYHNHLQEPAGAKIKEFLKWLRSFGVQVSEKEGLKRLIDG